MDKRTLIGLIVIGAILFGFTWYNSSIQEKLAQEQQTTTQQAASEAVEVPAADASATVVDSASGSAAAQLEQHIGVSLFKATEGTEKHYEIENDLMKVTFSNKGGRVASVVLKDYKTYNGSPLVLFPDSAAVFDLSFFVKQQFNNIQINTGDYYFVADSTADLAFGANETEKSFTMRLDVDSAAHVDFVYKIYKDNYMIDFDVRFVGMERLLAQNQSDLEIIWQNVGMQNEKGFDNENNYTTIAYKYPGDESIEQLGMSKEAKSETINSKLKWVAFKQQFFSSILVSQNDFQNGTVEYTTFQPGDLIFFGRKATPERKERVVHVGMYIGNKRFIHSQGDVRVNSFSPDDELFDEYNLGRLLFATRVLPYINKEASLNTTETNPFYSM